MASEEGLQHFHYRFMALLAEQPTHNAIKRTLAGLVETLQMTTFGPAETSVIGEDWNGMQMIAESHIALEGHGLYGAANIHSCKPFDLEAAARMLDEELGGWWHYRRVPHEAQDGEPR